MCVGLHLSAHAAHMCVSQAQASCTSRFLSLQFLNKACSVKWKKNTRESIIQLSRFPLSLQTEKNSESDHSIGVGAGERDCFYQHKLCFNREYRAVNPFGSLVQWQKQKRDKEHEAERDLWKSRVEKIEKLPSNQKLTKVLHSISHHVLPCG